MHRRVYTRPVRMCATLAASLALSLVAAAADQANTSCTSGQPLAQRAVRGLAAGATHDFDGDGLTDILASNRDGTSTKLFVLHSSDGSSETFSFEGGQPAPGDYDGDGKTDVAVVRQRGNSLEWEVRSSISGMTTVKKFGNGESKPVFGCRFLSSDQTSLATFQNGKLIATSLTSTEDRRIATISANSSAELIGCGDLSGDGVDEPLYQIPSRVEGFNGLATVLCSNQLVPYRTIKPFDIGEVVRLDSVDFPLVVAVRSIVPQKKSVMFQSASETFPYPRLSVANGSRFSSGIFQLPAELQSDTDKTSDGVLIQERGDATVTRILFDILPPKRETVTTLPSGFQLVRSQEVLR